MSRPLLAALSFAVLLCASPSQAGELRHRRIVVMNAGNEAIFSLRLGHDASPPVWSGDLLPFDTVIEVSEGREVALAVDPAACVADLQAVYRDAHAVVVKDVDLCTADRVDFTH